MKIDRSIVLFLIAIMLLAAAGGIFETTSNNYYAETFNITPEQRGNLELPREFPGLMVAVVAGALLFMGEAYMGAVAGGLLAVGMLGLALFANQAHQYANMLGFLIIWSAGIHLSMPVNRSLALALSGQRNEGAKLGALASIRSLATIVGCSVVFVYFKYFDGRFSVTFTIGACTGLAAAVAFIFLGRTMKPIHHGPRPRFLIKRRYGLYYVLSLLFGARKQVFITFGPWVIIRFYGRGAETFAILWIVTTALSMVLMPVIGLLIDRIGERAILMADAAVLVLVCLTYGFAGDLFSEQVAFRLVCTAYVTDHFLFGVQMARATYLSKIAESRADIGSTLSLGVSIDHAVSIPIAMVGGAIWVAFGSHRPVFLGAAVVAVALLIACSFIRIPRIEHPELVEEPEEALEDIRQEEI